MTNNELETLRIGHEVRVVTSSARMVVTAIALADGEFDEEFDPEAAMVSCVWLGEGGEPHEYDFPAACLIRCSE